MLVRIDAGPIREHTRRMMSRGKKPSPAEVHQRIAAARGGIQFDTGGRTFSEWWTDHKREERELEDRKLQRLAASGGRNRPPKEIEILGLTAGRQIEVLNLWASSGNQKSTTKNPENSKNLNLQFYERYQSPQRPGPTDRV